eukprot:TRINITY_DN1494_c0_g1_i1.p1 TRINITY_DN1494_c0_g1~~TRINITY_DN1494_c0_g1_i1.p1  ORF type:complete len:331 (+),score=120.09 TRINITY_DN1494_c0_g1_i1:78-1070(+)
MASSGVAKAVSMLQTQGLELVSSAKAKATVIVDSASTKAEALKGQAAETACQVRSRVDSLMKMAEAKAARAAEAVLGRTRSAVEYAMLQKKAVACSYQRLRTQGVKAWSLETARTGANMAKDVLANLRATATTTYTKSLAAALDSLTRTRQTVRITATAARERTAELQSKAVEVAKDSKFQATAAGAAGGAATLGAAGGATGLAAGSTLGAVVGLVPAIFTFGLSIPIGAAIGGGAGLVVGTAVGSTAGAVGGGAAGYGIHAKKDEIRAGAGKTLAKVSSGADFVREGAGKTLAKVSSGADLIKNKAAASAGYVKGRVSDVRSRLVAAGA